MLHRESFHWESCFLTGIASVDEQHHRLVDIINRFGEMITSYARFDSHALEEVFSELADYADSHFRDEESLMASLHVDARHQAAHRAAHHAFLEEVSRLHAEATADNTESLGFLLRFLTHWLAYHILGQDQTMARQIELINGGQEPAAAYQESHDHGRDPATAALLGALNGLFQEVSQRNQDLLRLTKTLEQRVAQRTEELWVANRRLERMAMTDTLTGLGNRRRAMQCLNELWREAITFGEPLACLMIDADGFKTINDQYGHAAGDKVLVEIATRLDGAVRTDDVVCRLGGDEFIVICPITPWAGAMNVANKVLEDICTLMVETGHGCWRGGVSIGVAARAGEMVSFDQLVKTADQGLYLTKHNGRGRVASVQSE